MSSGWGNPETSTFRKSNIREAKQGDARAFVHVVVRPLVEELWARWDEMGVDTTTVATNESDPLGLSFDINEDVELGPKALAFADRLGFEVQQGRARFVAKYEWAKRKSDDFQIRDMAELAPARAFQVEPVKGERPGGRELEKGDTGTDVMVLQLFLGLEPSGTFNRKTEQLLKQYQAGVNIPATGRADEDFWSYMLPRTIRWKRMGEAGREVRLVQSALVAFGYQPGPVTGRYGMVTNRALYALREDRGINGSTKIDTLVWEALFDLRYQYTNREFARAAAEA